MPKRSYGPKPQERAKRLLEDLLDYANGDIEVRLSDKLTINWEKNKPELSFQGTLESLVELTKVDKYPELLDKDKIEEAIDFFETYLENLSNFSQQGLAQRLFILKLCDTDKEKNLNYFDASCKVKDSGKLPNVRAASNSRVQVEGGMQSNQENLEMALASSKPPYRNLQKELTELRGNYKKLKDNFQVQEEANQELKGQIKITNSHLTIALHLLIIVIIPIEIGSGIIYDYLKDIYQTNNSSESRPANRNNSTSNTSSSNFPDLSKQTNTAYSQSQTQKPNCESKPEENSKYP
ncbi:MAG: hypothetical protein V7K90_01985 [Nostoc sp.]|uniref:hypothetical protein n=1 Tax=Nostoc sp. TaxID=1180 RepID=UPI002FFC3025